MQELSWNDFKYVLAIARAGGLTRAGDNLGVNLSTIFRRLAKIEETAQARLFIRSKSGYQPTDAGTEIIRAAETMEQIVFSAGRRVMGHDRELVGELRITATEALTAFFLAPLAEAFRRSYPELNLKLISENRVLDLSEQEADVALRPGRPEEAGLYGRRVAQLRWAVYAGSETLSAAGALTGLADFNGRRFVLWDDNPAAKRIESVLLRLAPSVDVVARSNSLVAVANMAAGGSGLALLPCFMGARWPNLRPVSTPLDETEAIGELWIVTHADTRSNAKVRALVNFVAKAARSNAKVFLGDRPDD